MRAWTSGTFSICMMFPLFFVVYLLIADWDRPRIVATCCSFIPCFSTKFLAIRAFMAGKTVFTPTSQGSSICSPVCLFLLETYINMTRVIIFMTRVMSDISKLLAPQSLTPLPDKTRANNKK